MKGESIGTRLERARRGEGMTQEELSVASGINRVTIARIETNAGGPPRPSTLRRLAETLDVEIGWLLYGEDADRLMGKVAA